MLTPVAVNSTKGNTREDSWSDPHNLSLRQVFYHHFDMRVRKLCLTLGFDASGRHRRQRSILTQRRRDAKKESRELPRCDPGSPTINRLCVLAAWREPSGFHRRRPVGGCFSQRAVPRRRIIAALPVSCSTIGGVALHLVARSYCAMPERFAQSYCIPTAPPSSFPPCGYTTTSGRHVPSVPVEVPQ